MGIEEFNRKLDEIDELSLRLSILNGGKSIIPHTALGESMAKAQRLIDRSDSFLNESTGELMISLHRANAEIESLAEYLTKATNLAVTLNDMVNTKDDQIEHFKAIIKSQRKQLNECSA